MAAADSIIKCPICDTKTKLGTVYCNRCGYGLKVTKNRPFKLCVKSNHENHLEASKCRIDNSVLVYFEKQEEARSCGRVLINFLLQCEALRIDITTPEQLMSDPKKQQYVLPPFKHGINSQQLCSYFEKLKITNCKKSVSEPEDYEAEFIIASLQYFGHFLKKQYLNVYDVNKIIFDERNNDFYIIQVLNYNNTTQLQEPSGHWFGARSINGKIYYAEPLEQMAGDKLQLVSFDNLIGLKKKLEEKQKQRQTQTETVMFNIYTFNSTQNQSNFMNIICSNCQQQYNKITLVNLYELSFNNICHQCNYEFSYNQLLVQEQVLSAASAPIQSIAKAQVQAQGQDLSAAASAPIKEIDSQKSKHLPITKAEADRIKAEVDRKAEEVKQARIKADKQAEADRIKAEVDRKAEEVKQARIKADKQAEADRIKAEADKQAQADRKAEAEIQAGIKAEAERQAGIKAEADNIICSKCTFSNKQTAIVCEMCQNNLSKEKEEAKRKADAKKRAEAEEAKRKAEAKKRAEAEEAENRRKLDEIIKIQIETQKLNVKLEEIRADNAKLDMRRDLKQIEKNSAQIAEILKKLQTLDFKMSKIYPEEIRCQNCTFSNKKGNKKCEVCENILIQSGGNAQYSKQQYKKLKSQYYKY